MEFEVLKMKIWEKHHAVSETVGKYPVEQILGTL
jgi:hypothetical protein